jgi:hypothetical protein
MKYIKLLLIFSVLVGSFSCESINEADQPLSDEQIAFNLSNNGENDPALLVGEWDCVKFAYTADGNKVSDVTEITKGRLEIPIVNHESGNQWVLHCVNSIWFDYSISNNLIELTLRGSTYVYVQPPHEEYDITTALMNAYSFVIKGNELIIYFTGVENKNLLILKKQ